MEKKPADTKIYEKVTEEPATVTVGPPATPSTTAPVTNETASDSTAPVAVQSAVQADVPAVKVKRATSEKQRKNYLAANARREQILADAKVLRVAEANEKKREKDAFEEYATATRLALKYGFSVPTQPTQPTQPPTQSVAVPVAPVRAAKVEMVPPPLRYYERPPTTIRFV
ncbi:hypothetical protein T492DRAFT_848300 [Pavlovales sp. CCMP2436]|nr:hypothetical protein T492DRAFT_848300 [Pavlovales sp. CCMP2436]